MPSPRSSKRQLEKARQEKAAMKREKRQSKGQGDDVATDGDEEPTREVSQDQVLADLAALHASFADESISFDDFEERKGELLRLLDLG